MQSFTLEMSEDCCDTIWKHLLPETATVENAGFGFVRPIKKQSITNFNLVDWIPLQKKDFDCQENDYLLLSDQARAKIIKHAHDTHTCLVEFHSHPFPYPAMFSLADINGLSQFVPHVWWRLKNKSFLAIVVAPSGFDALVWYDNPTMPTSLTKIKTEIKTICPTNLTINSSKVKCYG